MALLRGSAAYQKKDGTLTIAKDGTSISWTPVAPPGSEPQAIIPLSKISNLKQTPAASAKVMLKIFVEVPGMSDAEQHVFSFTSRTAARAEADAIRDALSKSIAAIKASDTSLAVSGNSNNTSAAMALASAVSSGSKATEAEPPWSNDTLLKSDAVLQKSLLEANSALKNTFLEALKTKPESMTTSQLKSQFWSTRVHLLRAHNIERSQKRGQYNVLSTIQIPSGDDERRLSVSKEQIHLIFSIHPLVKRIYDENVPERFTDIEFWSIFFVSRIFKKLKGEKITEDTTTNVHLDKYLSLDEDVEKSSRLMAAHVPHIIDMEGNEVNHSQRKGNDGDFTMRPSSKVPILRSLNAVSEKLISHMAPSDIDPSLPIGVDEETFNSLALRDLQGDPEENQQILNIRDQSRFFSSGKDSEASNDALKYAKQSPSKVLSFIRRNLSQVAAKQFLGSSIGFDSNSDSEDEENRPGKGHVGSRSSIAAATAQMLTAISQQREQSDDLSASSSGFSTLQTVGSTYGLGSTVFERLSLTHATNMEFMLQFWSAFLSGDPNRAGELEKLVESLNKALHRMKAVADAAETDRQIEITKLKQEAKDFQHRTGKKRVPNVRAVKGGAEVVNQLFAPTCKSIQVATSLYSDAWKKQSAAVR
ncbi:MAG: RNA polymerase II transcription factor B subunit 1 [Heterodermia speciosa]|uniref:RNA polymerase II transcription factor B subunit 1 n=1 Tax=Heterodermia speciosa TaxID=116794 RepID=A0A8H3IYJ1_9LECA|nr:MAG: RNA polymerase II transcription factor B subunit 1 [Heterodermia speciosa]